MGKRQAPRCPGHEGDIVMVIDRVAVGGASHSGNWLHPETTLLVDCAAGRFGFRDPSFVHQSGLWSDLNLNDYFNPMHKTIELNWPDGAAPIFLKKKFFEDVIDLARRGPKPRLVFACVGGHGRTGTALAAMRIIHFKETFQEAVQYVRNQHCARAVETREQLRWLAALEKGEIQ